MKFAKRNVCNRNGCAECKENTQGVCTVTGLRATVLPLPAMKWRWHIGRLAINNVKQTKSQVTIGIVIRGVPVFVLTMAHRCFSIIIFGVGIKYV
ncbi:MAG: hypothetical protein PHY56_00095 [Candidatus Omnitrophica bacterium]|nr:hypothetical protein [Candidatus Omnitrophota bacterium]